MISKKIIKKIISLFFISLFVFLNTGFGQEEPLLKEKIYLKFRKYNLEQYKSYHQIIEYNDHRDTISKIVKYYEYPDSLVYWSGAFFEYDSENRISKITVQRYNWNVDLWITVYWTDFFYDINNCITKKILTQNAGGFMQTLTYHVDSDCTIFESTDSYSSYDFFVYSYPDLNGSVTTKGFRNFSTGISEVYQKKITYNGNKDLTRREVIYRDSTASDTTLFSMRKYIYDYTFDSETGLVTFKNRKYFSNHGTSPDTLNEKSNLRVTSFYDYHYISEIREDHPYVSYQKILIYEGKNDCFDFDQNFGTSLSPNPTSGLVRIKSNMINSGDFQLRVFALDGKLVFKKLCQLRGSQIELDLSFLRNGIYIVSLNNGKKITSGKLVIAQE